MLQHAQIGMNSFSSVLWVAVLRAEWALGHLPKHFPRGTASWWRCSFYIHVSPQLSCLASLRVDLILVCIFSGGRPERSASNPFHLPTLLSCHDR